MKQNLEQCGVVAVAGAAIAVAILKQRQRKFSAGYMQNRYLQFPNLSYARPRLLFTLVFRYKKSTHHMKKGRQINIGEIKGKRRTKSEFTGKQVCTSEDKPAELLWIQFSSFFTCFFTYSLIEPMYFMADILLFIFLFLSMN